MSTVGATVPAVVLDRFGGPEVLGVRSIPRPRPAADEICVRVDLATVNPTDLLLRAGAQASSVESADGPWTPGMELAGVVLGVGTGCSDAGFAPGDPVVGLVDPRRRAGGAQAGVVCVPSSWLAHRPASLSTEEASALPMNGVTALMVLEALDPSPGWTVVVTGAVGALGGYVMSLLKEAGCVVIAHTRRGDDELARSLGATHVIADEDLIAGARAIVPAGADALVDTALLGPLARPAVRAGGTVVHVRGTAERSDDGRTDHVVSVARRIGDRAALERVVQWAVDGVLRPRVNRVLPVGEVAEAHRLVAEGGLRGRVLLDLSIPG